MTTLRYIGLCPVCMRDIKVRAGKLVHHGYERPGYGYLVGDCFGVHRQPHELSNQTAVEWLGVVRERTVDVNRQIAALPGVEVLYTQRYEQGPGEHHSQKVSIPIRRGVAPAWEWNQVYQSVERELNAGLRRLREEEARVEALVRDWEPRSLRTVEEESKKREFSRSEKATALAERRAAAVAKKVAYYQKLIDSKVAKIRKEQARSAKATSATLAKELEWKIRDLRYDLGHIHRDAPIGIANASGWPRASGYGVTEEQALAMLDRDNVWREFLDSEENPQLKRNLMR